MNESGLDATISVQEAAEAVRSACLYCNDNAETVGIQEATVPVNGSFSVLVYHGCKLTKQGRLQKLNVTVTHEESSVIHKERWAFTESELDDPTTTNHSDVFLAFLDEGHGDGEGLYVNRRGKVTGQYSDGSFGVNEEHREIAEDQDVIYRVISESPGFGRNLEATVKWKDVYCDQNGDFIAFNKG